MANPASMLLGDNFGLLRPDVQKAVSADTNFAQNWGQWDKGLSDQFDRASLQGIDLSSGAGVQEAAGLAKGAYGSQWNPLAGGGTVGWSQNQMQPLGAGLAADGDDRFIDGWQKPIFGNAAHDPTYGLMVSGDVANPMLKQKGNFFYDKIVPAAAVSGIAYGIGAGLMNIGAPTGGEFVGPPPELGPYGPGMNSGIATDFVGPPAEYGPYGPGLNDGIAADFVGPPPELNQYPFSPSGEFVGPPSNLSNGKSLFQSIKDLIKTPTPSGGGSGGSGGNGGGMNFSDWLNLGGTIAGIGTSIWSGNKQADAASDAAKLQAAGQAAALEEMKRQFDLSRADQMPWLTAGKGSLAQLSELMAPGGALTRKFGAADFEADPGYQFQLAEGEQAANRAAAARGGFNSGRTLKELMRYGQGLASTTYQDAYNRYNTDQSNLYNRLAGIAGTGQTAATTLGNAGANYAANVGNTLTGGANAQAASRIAGANARTSGYMGAVNAITGGINNYQQSQLLSQLLRQYGA